ncbi:MAG: hypothetical protein ACEPOZ_00055 [Marinifilaceae bacterium]
MKNRNTKVIGGDHIYAFTISCLCLITGIFFSLRSIPELSNIFYSLSLNLFLNWTIFRLFLKRRLKHLTESYNNIHITVFSFAAFGSTILYTAFSILFQNLIPSGKLLLIFAALAILMVPLGLWFYRWEKKLEILVRNYRMADWRDKEECFLPLKEFIENNDPQKILIYTEKNKLFNHELEGFLKEKIKCK